MSSSSAALLHQGYYKITLNPPPYHALASHQPFQNRTIPCSAPTLPKPHYPSKIANTLASLVKGRWIDGKAQTVALLLSACDMPTLFILQTFLPSRRRDCHTNLSPRTNPPKTALSLVLLPLNRSY